MAEKRTTKEEMIAVFEKIDTDSSGCLSIAELKEALNEIGFDRKLFKKILKEADKDGDGSITQDEFLSALGKTGADGGKLAKLVKEQQKLIAIKTKGGGVHSY